MKRNDAYYLKLAYKLALKAKGMTSPNPLVGSVVVKNGRIVGKGFHRKAGTAHAEIIAIENAGQKAEGASLYVTLEPCSHFGRTPPCVHKIIQSGVKEVIVGMPDPNPRNNGRGINILRQNKIKVRVCLPQDELKKMNEVFIKYITKCLPFVTVKVGQSLDGKIATHTGNSKWITSDKSRAFSRKIRASFDAIMVGVNTVLRDDPGLCAWFSKKPACQPARLASSADRPACLPERQVLSAGRQPTIIVVDSHLSTPASAKIFAKNSNVIIVTLPSKSGQETQNRKALSEKAKILEVKDKNGQINLRDMMKKLARMEISNILVEGGGMLIGSLFDEQLVDKVMFFISPKIIGGKDATSSVMGKGVGRVDSAIKLKQMRLRRIAEDILVEAYV